MDRLDIFAMDAHIRVVVTIGELQALYAQGCVDGDNDEHDELPTVNGEIV